MSINVGSNFLYQGKRFLDERIDKAKTLEDLKSWSIPVPDGFEVYVDGLWYCYNSTNETNEVTGKFKRRSDVSQDFGDSQEISVSQKTLTGKFDKIDQSLSKITAELFPLEFKTFTGGGTYEIGQTVTPQISWTIGIKGQEGEIIPTEILVNNSIEGVSENKKSWTGQSIRLDSPGNRTYEVIAKSDLLTASKTATYNFYFRKYYGTSQKEVLDSADILKLTGKAWVYGTSYTMAATKFDCTGGKYPYYVIPKSIYKSSLEMWVGGLKNTDTIIADVDVITATGLKITYTTIRLANIQSGNLSIEIK